MLRPVYAGRPQVGKPAWIPALRFPIVMPTIARVLGLSLAAIVALVTLSLAGFLFSVRAIHSERIFPALTIADVPVGGMSFDVAAAALAERGQAIEASPITLTYGDQSWTATWRDIGVAVDVQAAFAKAYRVGREDSALRRLQSSAALTRTGARLALPIDLDHQKLDRWFDEIDQGLGTPPRNAALQVSGSEITIVPEVDGLVVDRELARAEISTHLQNLDPIEAELPVVTRIATVRAVDLEPAKALVQQALTHPVQVRSGAGLWTLPASELARFLNQDVVTNERGAPTIAIGLERDALATWLQDRLAAEINTEPVDAEVGWNGERLISVEPSVDGVRLDAMKLAEQVEGQFFGSGGTVEAPLTYVKPGLDSANLGDLGITTLLGSGQSNYSGSSDGRSHNVAVGAQLLNGTLIPPWGEFSFNEAIGLIDEEKGFVEAQVISGEAIGKDIGGGICQVSTTVFRAAYLAGLPVTEWWPHRFRIGFYEFDDWEPGLDASILQPTDDPATWADFRFENPSDSWMLVESWTDGVNVVVNVYGADLGYDVESTGPNWGGKSQMLPPQEVVDDELDPGTVSLSQAAGIGEELSHYRVVRDRNGELLWERSFYTKYFPRGDLWKVSPDMKGEAPIDTTYKFPPLPPAGIDSLEWVPGVEDVPTEVGYTPPAEEWTPPAEEWTPPVDEAPAPAEEWAPPAEEWAPPVEEWVPPAGEAVVG